VQSVIKKLLIIFVSLAAVVFLIVAVSTMSANRSWRQHLAKLRAAGEPLTFADIQALRPPVPTAGDTVADVLIRIGKTMKASPVLPRGQRLPNSTKRGLDFFTGIRPGAVETAREYLAARLPAMAGIDDIRDLPPGRFAMLYGGPPMKVVARFFNECPRIHNMAKLLQLDATLKLIEHDADGPASTILLLLKIASPLEDEPFLIAYLNRVSASRSAIRVLENTLRVGVLDDEMLTHIDSELADFLASYTLKWALWGERAWFIGMRDHLRSAGGIRNTIIAVAAGDSATRAAARYEWLIEACDDPVKLLDASTRFDSAGAKPIARATLAAMVPALRGAVITHVHGLAYIRAARIAIAAERFRLTQGKLPDTLRELVPEYLPEIPADPFDGSPMKLTRTEHGLIIYSISDDEIDDGGDVAPINYVKRPPDVGFRLLDLDQRGVTFIDPPKPEDE
jgi:hypothetical protein